MAGVGHLDLWVRHNRREVAVGQVRTDLLLMANGSGFVAYVGGRDLK